MIRRARDADATAIHACLSRAFAAYESDYTPGAFRDTVPSPVHIRERIKRGVVLIAAGAPDEESAAGTLTAFPEGKHAHLRGMAVDPRHQGTGLARALLQHVEAEVAALGVRQITLEVTAPLERATHVYQSAGYSRTGRERPYFGMMLFEYAKAIP